MAKTLYVRDVADPVHDGIREVAFLCDLSMADVMKALAAQSLGLSNPHCGAVKVAASTWRKAHRNASA